MTVALLFVLQLGIGLAVMLGAFLLMAVGQDKHTPRRRRMAVLALFAAGSAYVVLPMSLERPTAGVPDLIFASAVAYALLRYGRQVRGILDGDAWWSRRAWADTTQEERNART